MTVRFWPLLVLFPHSRSVEPTRNWRHEYRDSMSHPPDCHKWCPLDSHLLYLNFWSYTLLSTHICLALYFCPWTHLPVHICPYTLLSLHICHAPHVGPHTLAFAPRYTFVPTHLSLYICFALHFTSVPKHLPHSTLFSLHICPALHLYHYTLVPPICPALHFSPYTFVPLFTFVPTHLPHPTLLSL